MRVRLLILILLGFIVSCIFYSGAVSGECVPYWYCYEWGECSGGQQVRTCYDSNACGLNNGPPLSRACVQQTGEGSIIIQQQPLSEVENVNAKIRLRNAVIISLAIGIVLIGAIIFVIILYRQQRTLHRREELFMEAEQSFGERE